MGTNPKINDSSRLCLLATIMDYPFLSDKERTAYLYAYWPNDEKNVTEKTVNNELNKLNFLIKTPEFSPKGRNTFGFLIVRHLWGNPINDIMQNEKIISCIIDKASVKKAPMKNAKGFLSFQYHLSFLATTLNII